MNNLTERIRVFSDKNKASGITPTGGYLIPYEKISHDRFGYPRYLVHYTDLGLKHYSDTIGKITGLKKYRDFNPRTHEECDIGADISQGTK